MAFDLSLAFDTLAHSTLLSKLKIAGVTRIPLKTNEAIYLRNFRFSATIVVYLKKGLTILKA